MPLIDLPSGKIFIARRGSAHPTLVLLHGAAGSHTHWGAQLAGLSPRYRVVCPDLPGHGRSPGPAPTTIAAYADAVLPLLDDLDGPIVLGGHSMGGAVALTLAARAPQRFAGLLLVGSGAQLPIAPSLFDGLATDPQTTLAKIAARFLSRDANPELREQAVRTYQDADPITANAAFSACAAFDLRDQLGRIAVPTLIICGEHDVLTPPALSHELAAGIAQAQLQIIANAGHSPMIEYASSVNALIAAWLPQL